MYNYAEDAFTPPRILRKAVVVKIFKTALILYAQGPGFTAVKQDCSDH